MVSENLDSRSWEDAKLRRGFEEIWIAEGLKMRRCDAAEAHTISADPLPRRCEDVKLRRGFQKIWIAEVAKMQRCEAAERVSENLDSRSCEDAKMRSCGEGLRKSG